METRKRLFPKTIKLWEMKNRFYFTYNLDFRNKNIFTGYRMFKVILVVQGSFVELLIIYDQTLVGLSPK